MNFRELNFEDEIIEEVKKESFVMAVIKFDNNKNVIHDSYKSSDYCIAAENRENLYKIKQREKILEQYNSYDDMRYGINRMDEWDRGYYSDNPYCYSWEVNNIPLSEEYYDSDSESEYDDSEDEN